MQAAIMTFGPKIPAHTTMSEIENPSADLGPAVKEVIDRFLEEHPDAWTFTVNIRMEKPKPEEPPAGETPAGDAPAA